MPFVMLKQQRRMKPELRYILKPFYPELYDHPSVESINHRPDVLGMGGRNSWLFDHTWPEGVNSDFSKFNEQEAEMITNFFAYLVANGTPAEKITVLTFYKGQRKVLLKKLKSHPAIIGSTFNVCTVDSYQGEENDIILLSLVRSPQLNRAYAVGFLEDERRAVVAISRARRGFYIFGNVDNGHEMVIDDVYKPTTVEIGQEVATQKLPVLQLLPALQPFVSQRNPTQLPESHLDLLSDPIPLETSAFGKTYSIAHDQALTPFPSIPVAEDLVPLSGAINSYPAHAPPTCTQVQAQAQGQGQSRNQIQTVRQEDGGTQIEDGEEWLIQL
ncbi:AAA domain-containing protein [Corynascus novoguineensis]|uniref:AAA domain-containing protein n=1 Tax=Corynascus novoguineensis TaxID=1126955 RepID=A0AAN7CTR4_9PEZI|nr:AAA domain-containing protein [Corynascus novoguineensis]